MKGGTVCRNSHTYARDMIQYIYSKDGKAYSVINREASDLRVQIEILPRCDAVRGLLRAVDNGLKVRSQKLRLVAACDCVRRRGWRRGTRVSIESMEDEAL
jgi:hypothetical protein